MGIAYTTRESVKAALDVAETARNNTQIDRAIDAGADSIWGLTRRKFYPTLATRKFDWPNFQLARPWRLWLDSNELISATSVVSGGVTIPPSNYLLRRSDDVQAPPYTFIEINLGTSSSWSGGVTTPQQSIVITGVWGSAGATTDEASAGTTAAAVIDANVNSVDVGDSAAVGVGDLLRIDTERVQVTGKQMLTTTQTLSGNLTALASNTLVGVTNGALFAIGETVLIDAERMLVEDIAGNSLVVQRGWDGSVLAAHTAAAVVYAPRRLIVRRGVLGTTAAAHLIAASIWRHEAPPLIRELNLAEAVTTLLQESSGWARTAGAGDNVRESTGKGLADLRAQVVATYGRKARTVAI